MQNRASISMAAALGVALMVSACGVVEGAVEDAVGNAVEDGVENAIEDSAGGDVDINVNADGGAVDLPADFPTGIPLPDGATLTSSLSSPDGWYLSYTMTDFAPADDLAAELTADAAWVTELESLADAMKSWSFSNDEYQYVILAIGENDEFVMSLSLTPKSS